MIDERLFRQAMSRFASGVTVVTTAFEGQLAGLTVSAFTSLSLKPTLVLVSIGNYNESHSVIMKAGRFAVNILRDTQVHVSQRFAARGVERFVPDTYLLSERGLPLLHGCLVNLECEIVEQYAGGDHTIFIGEVLEAYIHSGEPLLYYRSSYARLGDKLEP